MVGRACARGKWLSIRLCAYSLIARRAAAGERHGIVKWQPVARHAPSLRGAGLHAVRPAVPLTPALTDY